MLVWRWAGTARSGDTHKLFNHIIDMHKKNPWPHTMRVYKSKIGLQDQVIVEAECESLAEWEEAQKQWGSRLSKEDSKIHDLIETRGSIEFLTVTAIPNE